MLHAIEIIMELAIPSSTCIESEQPSSNCLDIEHVFINLLLLSVACETM
jgi:hypothetical protein